MSDAAKDTRDMLAVFIESLHGADRVVVETKNALGEMDAHYMHAPEILTAWNTRTDTLVGMKSTLDSAMRLIRDNKLPMQIGLELTTADLDVLREAREWG